jgi:hypothetical protein
VFISLAIGGSLALLLSTVDDVQMITVASFPADLGIWDQDQHPFYLEVLGESEPVMDASHCEVVPPGRADVTDTSATPVYEYWWTIGHGGSRPEHNHLFESRAKLDLWHRLDPVAARVYLYFPISGGWRVQELAASAKYLRPVQNQSDWTEKAAEEWQRLQPILAGASQAAGVLTAVPGVGVAAASMAPVLSAVSKLQLGAVPQGVKGFDWYVEKVTFPAAAGHGVMQGVMWAIPKEMLELLGGRLNGSLAVSFIPTAAVGQESPLVQTLPVLAHAAVYSDGEAIWAPARNKFVELPLTPRMPKPVPAEPNPGQ